MTRTHEVENAAQAEQVGAVIDGLAAGLFWRHVLRSPGNDATLGQAGVVDSAGEAEVGQLHPFHAVLQEDIRGFDVAMHQALRVSRRQSLRGLNADS